MDSFFSPYTSMIPEDKTIINQISTLRMDRHFVYATK